MKQIKVHSRNQLIIKSVDSSQVIPRSMDEGSGSGWILTARENHLSWVFVRSQVLPKEIILTEGKQ